MFQRAAAAVVVFALLECGGLGMAAAQERPSKETMDAVRSCFGKAGISASSGSNKPPQLTAEQRKAVDKCLKDAGIEIPSGRP